MLKSLSCALLFACAASAHAADWQRDFFSPMTNELPPTRGAVVDDLGYVHLQAFNRQQWAQTHDLVHQYTLAADGSVPWIWGLSQANGMSDCGVFARGGERLDCLLRSEWGMDFVQLELRGIGGHVQWQTLLPPEATLRAASIPSSGTALVVAEADAGGAPDTLVFEISPWGQTEVLSVTSACPQAGQVLRASALAMPQDAFAPIHRVKACWNSYGTTDLIAEQFDRQTRQWQPVATQSLWYGESIERAAIAADGASYLIGRDSDGQRQLWTTQPWWAGWFPHWLPDGEVVAFEAGAQGLLAGLQPADPHAPVVIAWAMPQTGGWPQFQLFPQYAGPATVRMSATADGAALILRTLQTGGIAEEHLDLAYPDGRLIGIAPLPLAPGETLAGPSYALPTPDGGAVVARTVQGSAEFGPEAIGVTVQRYALPMP